MSKNATAEKQVEEEVRRVAPVTVSRFGLEAEFNTVWRVNVEQDTTPEDTLKDDFWQHLSSRLVMGDTIVVKPDHLAWKQVLEVLDAGRNYAIVQQLELYDLESAAAKKPIPSDYKIEHAGQHYKWRVLLGDRNLKDGFASKALAVAYASNHQAAVDR